MNGEELKTAVERRAAELLATSDEPAPLPTVSSDVVRQCLQDNSRGDGVLFARLNKGRYLYNSSAGGWYAWVDHVWQDDESNDVIRTGVELVVERYREELALLQDEIADREIKKNDPEYSKIVLAEALKKRVDRCHTRRGAEDMLWYAATTQGLQVTDRQIDQRPLLLPCLNGVIDLRRGVLLRGRPDDFLTRRIEVAFDPSADTSPCVEFLRQVIGDNSEEIGFFQRSMGATITGFAEEQYLWLLLGEGRNGKGVLMNIMGAILGPFFHTINSALLIARKTPPSPAATSEHFMALRGKRMIMASETNEFERIDAREVKKLTGDDILNARPNYGKEINFKPTHSTWLATNHVPLGLTSDFPLLQRLLVLDFPYSFVADPAAESRLYPTRAGYFKLIDKQLKRRMLEPEMLTRWLKWMVDGCIAWQERGLDIPQSVIDRRQRMEMESDYFYEFVTDCLQVKAGERTKCTELYQVFKRFYAATQEPGVDEARIRYPTMRTMTNALRKRGYVLEKQGVYYVFGAIIPESCPYRWDNSLESQATVARWA